MAYKDLDVSNFSKKCIKQVKKLVITWGHPPFLYISYFHCDLNQTELKKSICNHSTLSPALLLAAQGG